RLWAAGVSDLPATGRRELVLGLSRQALADLFGVLQGPVKSNERDRILVEVGRLGAVLREHLPRQYYPYLAESPDRHLRAIEVKRGDLPPVPGEVLLVHLAVRTHPELATLKEGHLLLDAARRDVYHGQTHSPVGEQLPPVEHLHGLLLLRQGHAAVDLVEAAVVQRGDEQVVARRDPQPQGGSLVL